jgi:hypothetical protein
VQEADAGPARHVHRVGIDGHAGYVTERPVSSAVRCDGIT